jgi:hypothetical protein
MIRILILFSLSFTSFAQKSEIVFKSSIKHNYVIGNDYYVEDAIDTTRLLFMGIIKITCTNQDEFIADAQRILKTKAKELNGNCYKLKSFILLESSISLLFDVYFAPEAQVEIIKSYSLKDKIIIFNSIKSSASRLLIINSNKQYFSKNKRLEIFATTQVELNIDTTGVPLNSKIKIVDMSKNKKVVFLTIKLRNDPAPAIVGGAIGGAVGAIIGNSVAKKRKDIIRNEFFSNINYNTGRILMVIYPLDKQITLD